MVSFCIIKRFTGCYSTMQTPFKTIGIIGKPSDPGIAETLTGLYDYLTQHQYTVYVAEDSVKFIKNHAVAACSIGALGQHCDLVIACLLYTSPSPRDRQKYRM